MYKLPFKQGHKKEKQKKENKTKVQSIVLNVPSRTHFSFFKRNTIATLLAVQK
jgi:hypothetical protein